MVICEVSNEHKALLCLISSLCSQGAGSWWAQHCWVFPSACPLKSRIWILTTSHPFIVSAISGELLRVQECCTPAKQLLSGQAHPQSSYPAQGNLYFTIQGIKTERKVLHTWLGPGLGLQEQEQPAQLRKIRGDREKSPKCCTQLCESISQP